MSRTIEFTVSNRLLRFIDEQAAARGKTRAEFVRDATIAYLTKYPARGCVADLLAPNRTDPKNLGSGGKSSEVTC